MGAANPLSDSASVSPYTLPVVQGASPRSDISVVACHSSAAAAAPPSFTMLRAFTERRDSGQGSSATAQEKSKTWNASNSKQNVVPKSKTNHKRKSFAKPKVTFKSQMSGKRHKALASLLVSFLATSSVAIDMEAADEKTIDSANKASSTPSPAAPPKAHTRSSSGVKASETRKTRLKRFKYEMGLKMKSGPKNKPKQSGQREEMELVDMMSQEREHERQQPKRVGTA
ncbi:hypothetical protein EK21DRAFT_83471 [Setomelanomma holmii]|uniref:Uncharacterized protein n=1 Tax=Setomelanomma holmii TaxID=210430 RepID=A0A9P4HM38_9PLEO|nr:hypothetical protein EK21DRAFT_83471 [Setomelanomma holmii]